MAITGKAYLNFLGGEVSPNAYKRLDMANNGKWFETAKNIYFGTTGDFQNRRGFIHIGKPHEDSFAGEKIKLIPFVYNRSQSYCIAFYDNDFSILKNGSFLTDGLGNRIYVQHSGFSMSDANDISYCQIGDIVYIAARGQNNIYTITRRSDAEWVWDIFDYEIPPMQSTNSDKNKMLVFEENVGYTTSYTATFDTSFLFMPFGGITLECYKDTGGSVGPTNTLFTTNESFQSVSSFVSYFNNNNLLHPEWVTGCALEGNNLVFYFTQQAITELVQIKCRLLISSGAGTQRTLTGDNPFQENNYYGESHTYYFTNGADAGVKEATIVFKSLSGTFTRTYSFAQQKTLSEFTAFVGSAALENGMNNLNWATYTSPNQITTFCYHTSNHGVFGFESVYFTNVKYITPISGTSDTRAWVHASTQGATSGDLYNVTATFNFFSDKDAGDFFSVESIFSPSRDGKAGQNKSYYQDSGSFPTVTDAFWSNGNWRFVTSGLFKGSIELQYSYDGASWYTHRTFSSTIRTENNVSYGTNYNEYGTLDVDDNVLLRLKFDLSSQVNLCVLLDTESFKNRAYYKVVSKISNTSAVVQCVKYNIGVPGITKYNSGTASYDVSPVYEWAESAWSSVAGFPKIVFFYQNRLGFASTNKNPQTIWFSRTDNFKDFSTKIEYTDDDPITISALRSTGISEINTIASAKKLFVFTADHEDGIQDEGALTQANKQLIGFTYYGSEPIETRNISNKIIFVERGGHAARALTYDFSQDNYDALDLTIPYKHLLTNEKIISTEYLPGDYKTYLMLTSSGRIICFKYLPEQKIEACSWFAHANGKITNICVVYAENGYELYVALDSGKNKFIEYLDIKNGTPAYLDSYRIFSFDSETSSITDSNFFVPGVEYVVMTGSERYNVVADANSSITLKSPETSLSVGIKYVAEATLIEPNLLYQNGTTNYNRKNMYKAFFTYVDSVGFKVGVKNKERSFKQVFSLPLSSIDVEREKASGERNFILQSSYLEPNMLSFVQEEPHKMHITNSEVEVDYGGK